MMKRMMMVAAAVAMMAGVSFGQFDTAANLISLGGPHVGTVGLVNLIDDPMDVITFPSEVTTYTDMVQGSAGNTWATNSRTVGYVYGAKQITDMLSIGLIFNAVSYVPATGFGTNATTLTATARGAFASTSANQLPWNGSFSLANPGSVGSVAHLLASVGLGSNLSVGLDVFREAANSSWKRKDVDVSNPANIDRQNSEGFSNIGAKGLTAGVGLKLGSLNLRLSTGYVMMNYSAEDKQSGTRTVVATGTTTTYNNETSNIEATKGSYLPVHAKVGFDMGMHKFCLGVSFEMIGQQFEAKFNDGDDAVAALTPLKSDAISTTNMGIGVADKIQILENTILVPSVSIYSNTVNTKPDNVDNTNPELTTTTYGFPVTSLGFEHSLKSVWKFDEVLVRAGGSKAITWTATESKGTDATSETSGAQTASTFAWTLGAAFVMSNLELAMTVNPATLNGIYFVSGQDAGGNGVGPRGANVTLTYRFGSNSSSIPGMAPSPAM